MYFREVKSEVMAYYHLGELIHEQAKKYGSRTALKYQDEQGMWVTMAWSLFSERIMKAARALAEMGVRPNDNVGVYSQNMEQYLVTDLAAFANRAVVVPMYATASPEQVSYIVNDAGIKVLFVGEQFQYNNAYMVQQEPGALHKLIVFDRQVVFQSDDTTSVYFDDFIATGENSRSLALVNARLKQLKMDDLAAIIYTSGTTGEPKG